MILVTLGTQQQKFYRLLKAIEDLNLDEEIIVQAGGSSDYKSDKLKIFKFISYDEMNELLKRADLVITHGGTGSILGALKNGKKVIACPRLLKYGEHVDDHQKEIVENFASEGYLLKFAEEDNLKEIYDKSINFKPTRYKSNKDVFIQKLLNKIN